jgi:hypothetical protein
MWDEPQQKNPKYIPKKSGFSVQKFSRFLVILPSSLPYNQKNPLNPKKSTRNPICPVVLA